MEHTKGKWEHNAGNEKRYPHVKIGEDLLVISTDNAEANARLIAAAPELLAACENLVRGQLQHPSFKAYVKHAVWVAEQAIKSDKVT